MTAKERRGKVGCEGRKNVKSLREFAKGNTGHEGTKGDTGNEGMNLFVRK
jgi:hypothetical protein